MQASVSVVIYHIFIFPLSFFDIMMIVGKTWGICFLTENYMS